MLLWKGSSSVHCILSFKKKRELNHCYKKEKNLLYGALTEPVLELVIVNTNKQVSDYKDTGVDGYIGDESLNEIDRIAKKYCWSV